MITRRELDEFQDFLVAQAARLIDVLNHYGHHFGSRKRAQMADLAIVLAWRNRNTFLPHVCSRVEWFGQFAEWAKNAIRTGEKFKVFSEDEREMLRALGDEYDETARNLQRNKRAAKLCEPRWEQRESKEIADEIKKMFSVEPQPEILSECPPCWRCRYFDGWLPMGELVFVEHLEEEITIACRAIDTRKVMIANWVRGRYPDDFKGVEDEPT